MYSWLRRVVGGPSAALTAPPQIVDGAVAIHQWLESGEGWAAHPSIEEHCMLFLGSAVVSEELAARCQNADGEVRIKKASMLGGYLMTVHVVDTDCQDPRAAERYPTILRVTFCRELPTGERMAAIAAILKTKTAVAHGPDATLIINTTQWE